ncbi:MAG: hypothetical protein ACJASV_003202 [Pseudorhodobacter sp.]
MSCHADFAADASFAIKGQPSTDIGFCYARYATLLPAYVCCAAAQKDTYSSHGEEKRSPIMRFPMAYTTTTTTAPIQIRSLLARPFVAVFNFLILVAEANPRMADIRKLNETSDEELATRGLTRTDEINRIFRGRFYI